MIRIIRPLAPFALCLAPALATIPAQAAPAQDNRVVMQEFIANEVIDFTGHAGFQSTIRFEDGERIENIAVGASNDWQVTPNRRADLLFLKPTRANAATTNMTVVTDRRTYLFALSTRRDAQPVFLMQFAYAEPFVPEFEAEPEAEAGLQDAVLRTELPLDHMNFAWSMSGKRKLYPERIFDDGHSVYLAWSEGRALPAVLAIGPDGETEGPVNYTAEGDYLVVEGFHNRLVLRSGEDSAILSTSRPAPDQVAMAAQNE